LRQKDATEALASRRDEVAAARSRVQASPSPKPAPEQWLQGIADLRRQGRHEEADKALAEFRRAYPDYKISEAILEKVEKR
jgi:TolA-binding protein